LFLLFAFAMALGAPGAVAGPGYGLAFSPSIPLGAEDPIGIAVDQSSEEIYVAELSKVLTSVKPGQIEQLDSSGAPTAESPFTTGGQDLFVSVAVNPLTHGIYAYQGEGETPLGWKGKSTLSSFSDTGVLGTSFFPANSSAGTIAVDSSGRVYFPNSVDGSVQIFSGSGTLEGTITCSGCPGGEFGEPSAVAFDSAGALYVVDKSGAGRVVKLNPTVGGYAYDSTLQAGGGPIAVAVDTVGGDVFVGNLVGNKYHVIVYDASGTAFDDFGAGLVTKSVVELATGQLAVNSNTQTLYLTNPGGKQLWVFEPIGSIPAPTAAIAAPTPVGQVEATLRANLNPKAHVLTTCHFEYTTHADFLANGYTNAKSAACPPVVGEKESTVISTAVSGLTPGASYDYRVQVASFGGSAESGPQAFETLPPLPPEAVTGAATSVTLNAATLGGTVNPKGGKITNCHFEYVSEAAFLSGGFNGATSKTCSTTPSGNAAVAVSAKLSGLVAGTAYRFRVVATNGSGTGTAVDKSFATVAETCAENAAMCPAQGGSSTPSTPAPSPVIASPPRAPAPKKPLKCRKGFKKKTVHGKAKCVKVKKRHRPR
jgi:hypothetical protein